MQLGGGWLPLLLLQEQGAMLQGDAPSCSPPEKEQELDKLVVPFLKKKKKKTNKLRVNAGISVAGEDLLTHSPI